MAVENVTWGYTRIQGALKNLGHGVGRSTIARILKEQGIPPSGRRPMAWRTFIAAHWPALLAADFFTSLAGTLQGLVLHYIALLYGAHPLVRRVAPTRPSFGTVRRPSGSRIPA
jgi:hypothetical protein